MHPPAPDDEPVTPTVDEPVNAAVDEVVAPPADEPVDEPVAEVVDLERIAADLDDVATAMERIEAGTYWTDELTGAPIPDDVLAAFPTARRAPASTSGDR